MVDVEDMMDVPGGAQVLGKKGAFERLVGWKTWWCLEEVEVDDRMSNNNLNLKGISLEGSACASACRSEFRRV